jgi:Glyoxalase/Bleomycin resistance protein/Dioxygenase superfamily
MTGNVLGIDHVALVVRGENIDAVAAEWERALGLDFEEVNRPDLGLRIKIDLDAGVELVAPLGDVGSHGPFFQRYLDEHGEGFQSIIFRVGNLEQATDRAAKAGKSVIRTSVLRGDEPWFDRYSEFVELPLEPINGIHATVARIEQIPERRRPPKHTSPSS